MENEKNNTPASPEQAPQNIETVVPSTHQPEKTDQAIASDADHQQEKEAEQPGTASTGKDQSAHDQKPATDQTAEKIEEHADERQRNADDDQRDEVETVTPRS